MGRASHGLAVSVLVASMVSAQESETGAYGPFPRIELLNGNVEFWTRVFSDWDTNQLVVHDRRWPMLVYEVVQLPGESTQRYSDEQRQFVRDLNDAWESELKQLSARYRSGEPFTEAQRELAERMVAHGGAEALGEAHEEVRVQRGLRSRFRDGIERSGRYLARFQEIFREAGLPEDLAYLPHVESSFQAFARSHVGATGMWQFTRGTGRQFMAITGSADARLDPIASARGAAAFLGQSYAALGDWSLAITAYNHGLQGMLRAREQVGADFGVILLEYEGRSFGFASRNFYAEFLAAREVALNADRYFPEGYTLETPDELEAFLLEERTAPSWLALRYGVPLEDLAAINPAWSRRAVKRNWALPAGLTVWLPPGTLANAGDGPVVQTYTVGRGDTLTSIARRFGVTVDDLRAANGMSARQSVIRIGQELVVSAGIPRAASTTIHVVRPGDTLIRIAATYGVALEDVLLANGLSRRSVIHPGQELRILF